MVKPQRLEASWTNALLSAGLSNLAEHDAENQMAQHAYALEPLQRRPCQVLPRQLHCKMLGDAAHLGRGWKDEWLQR